MNKTLKSRQCSKAGKLGCAVRWSDHVKIETALIRINKNDHLRLSALSRRYRLSIASVVHTCIEHCSDRFFHS